MGFWNLFLGKKPVTESNVRIIGEMTVDDQSYIVTELHVDLCQDMDNKNQPNEDLRLDTMIATLNGEPDKFLTRWSLSPSMIENGEIHFYSYVSSSSSGALFSIYFKQALCLNLRREKDIKGKTDITIITLSPESVTLGNEELQLYKNVCK